MLHHACEPTHPVPTSQDTPQTTNDSIEQTHPHPTSQDTSLKISMFTDRRQKCRPCKKTRSNENLCATFRPKMVLSKLQWLKLPAPNLLQKCSQEVFPQLKSFGFMAIWSQNSKICKKGPKAKKLRPNILDAKFGWNLAKKTGSSSWFSARSPKRGLKFEIRIGSDSAASLPIVKLSSTAQLRPLFVSGL